MRFRQWCPTCLDDQWNGRCPDAWHAVRGRGSLRGRRAALDVHQRQMIAGAAVASSWLSMAVCIGMAIATWSDVAVYAAGIIAVAGAVIAFAAVPGQAADPRVTPLPDDVVPWEDVRAEQAAWLAEHDARELRAT